MKSFIHDTLHMRDRSIAGIAAAGLASLADSLKRTCWQTAQALRFAVACVSLIVFLTFVAAPPAFASENPLYTITGVEVDVRAETAAEAKKLAITQANVKAFALFAQRVGGDALADRLSDIPSKRIDAMLDSLSIEEERTGPQRYIGKLTVRFLPGQMRKMMAELGRQLQRKAGAPDGHCAGVAHALKVWCCGKTTHGARPGCHSGQRILPYL